MKCEIVIYGPVGESTIQVASYDDRLLAEKTIKGSRHGAKVRFDIQEDPSHAGVFAEDCICGKTDVFTRAFSSGVWTTWFPEGQGTPPRMQRLMKGVQS